METISEQHKTDISLLASVNKANFWVDSWHPYLFISRNLTDQEKNGYQFSINI